MFLSCPLGVGLIQSFSASVSGVPRNTEEKDTDQRSRIPLLISTLTRMGGRHSLAHMARSKYGSPSLQRLRLPVAAVKRNHPTMQAMPPAHAALLYKATYPDDLLR